MADEAALRVETAIETFLGRLPLWRGGQRDAGKSLPSVSPERKDRSPKKDKEKDRRAKEREKEREKEKEKEKGRDKDRDRDRDKDRDKDRKKGRESRSVSNKRKKDKDKGRKKDRSKSRDRPAKNASRSRSRSPKEQEPKERKSGFGGFGAPPSSVQAPPPPAPLQASQRAPVPVAASNAAVPPNPSVPDWISDLVGGSAKPSRREVMVPQQSVSRLIGKGGEHIMKICNTTGADVRVNQGTKEMGYSLAVITGHPDKVEAAERLVRQQLGLSVTGSASKEVAIPNEHASAVMNSLAKIRLQSGGCPMDLKNYPTMGWRAILGPANNEQLMVAEQLLTATLAEAMVAGIQRSI